MLNFDKKIVLASASPRRKELLASLDINFDIEVRKTNERINAKLDNNNKAIDIAEQKMQAFNKNEIINDNKIVITADTLVFLEDNIMGKPKNKDQAFEMLKLLRANVHDVITGCCITDGIQKQSFSIKTKVYFTDIDDNAIKYYIENFKPFDKAGAYGIQEWIGYSFVDKIEGSYNNVVGLPTKEIYKVLKENYAII